MGKFLKENWLYILLPIVLVLAGILYLVYAGEGSGPSKFGGYEL